MIIKLFGILDLIAAVLLIFLKYGLGESIAYFFVGYLILKGLLFFGDINSFMDVGAGIFMLLALYGIFNILTWIFILWLLQKSFFSLVA